MNSYIVQVYATNVITTLMPLGGGGRVREGRNVGWKAEMGEGRVYRRIEGLKTGTRGRGRVEEVRD